MPAGERVLNWARQVLSSLDGLRQEADLIRAVPGGHLAIGAVPSTVGAVTLLAAEFRRLIPNLTLETASLSAQEILRRLKRQDLHLGITYGHLPGTSRRTTTQPAAAGTSPTAWHAATTWRECISGPSRPAASGSRCCGG